MVLLLFKSRIISDAGSDVAMRCVSFPASAPQGQFTHWADGLVKFGMVAEHLGRIWSVPTGWELQQGGTVILDVRFQHQPSLMQRERVLLT